MDLGPFLRGVMLEHNLRGAEKGSSLLDLAARDDFGAFRHAVKEEGHDPDAFSVWYGRQGGSDHLLVDQRTPAMVASEHGSVNVLSFLLSSGLVDVNKRSRAGSRTALHFCAAGASQRAAEACSLLLRAGADRCIEDACGRRPADEIVSDYPQVKASLERQLLSPAPIRERAVAPSVAVDIPGSPLAKALAGPSSPRHDFFASEFLAPESGSPPRFLPGPHEARRDHRGFVLDPSVPDVTSSVYMSDDFRMFSFKIKPCLRTYSHDWTECPFAHPGEAARRRDPRQHPYSCLPCPDFRKGACARGETCDFAHGVFESWLHPAQYRTRLCKDGPGCDRRVCFFAHLPEELRPVASGWGTALPLSYASPMSPSLEKRQFSPPLPASPSSVLLRPGPFSPGPGSPVGKHLSTPQAFSSPPRSPVLSPDHIRGSPLRGHQMIRRLSGEFRRETDCSYEGLVSPHDVSRGPLISPHAVSRWPPMSPHDVSREVLQAEEARLRRLGDAYEAGRLMAELNNFSLGGRARPPAPQHSPRLRPVMHPGPQIPPVRTTGDDPSRRYERPLSPQMLPERQVRNPRSPLGGAIGLPAVQRGGPYGRSGGLGNPRSMSQQDMVQNGGVVDHQRLAHSRFARSNTWEGQISDWGSPRGTLEWGVKKEEVEKARVRRQAEAEGSAAAGEPDISWVTRIFEEEPVGAGGESRTGEVHPPVGGLGAGIWADIRA